MAAWSALDEAGTRAASLAAFDALKADGDSKLWSSFRIAPRAVSLGELTRTTQIEEKALDPTASEFSIEDIRDTFIKVLIGCTLASTLFSIGSEALGMDAGFRFTGTYLIAGIPIGVLAVGSTAPGILFLPVEAFRSITAGEEAKRTRAERVCKHEASHLLCAYVLGLPIQEVETEASGPRVVVYDEEMVQQPGKLIPVESVDPLAVVAMSGLMAEADAYGQALGASEDLKLLNQMLVRCQPPIPSGQMQDKTRYAALTAWSIVKRHEKAFDAIVAALGEGKSLAACLEAAEAAEAGQSAADATAAAAKAAAIVKETPQEKAARERAEDAARGRF